MHTEPRTHAAGAPCQTKETESCRTSEGDVADGAYFVARSNGGCRHCRCVGGDGESDCQPMQECVQRSSATQATPFAHGECIVCFFCLFNAIVLVFRFQLDGAILGWQNICS